MRMGAERMDNPKMMIDREVLLPGESKQRRPPPECTAQILSQSICRLSPVACAGSAACVSSDVSSGASRQISQSPFNASGKRSRPIASLRIISKMRNLVVLDGGCQAVFAKALEKAQFAPADLGA